MFLGFWKTLSKRFFGFVNLPKGRPYSHVLEGGDARMIPSVVWLFDFYGPSSLKIKEPLVSILLWETILLSFLYGHLSPLNQPPTYLIRYALRLMAKPSVFFQALTLG